MNAPLRLRAAAVAAAALVAGVAACRDPLRNEAQFPVVEATLAPVALTGTGPGAPSALVLRGPPTLIAPDAVGLSGLEFDLAVDIDASGRAVFYPASLVDRRAFRRVGMRRVTQSYDSLSRAPRGTYVADSAFALAPGEVIAVQVPIDACAYAASPYFFSKIVVDEVRVASRTVVVRATTDPNCGFRSLVAGIPRD